MDDSRRIMGSKAKQGATDRLSDVLSPSQKSRVVTDEMISEIDEITRFFAAAYLKVRQNAETAGREFATSTQILDRIDRLRDLVNLPAIERESK